jgi:hypothetical protein
MKHLAAMQSVEPLPNLLHYAPNWFNFGPGIVTYPLIERDTVDEFGDCEQVVPRPPDVGGGKDVRA